MTASNENNRSKIIPWVSLTVGKGYRSVLRASDVAAGRVLKAILSYAADPERKDPGLEAGSVESVLFGQFLEDLDDSIDVYLRKVEGGRNGGRSTQENKRNPKESLNTPQGDLNDSSTQDIDSQKDNRPIGRQTDHTPSAYRYTAEEIRAVCRANGFNNVDADRVVEVNEARGWLVNGGPIRDLAAYLKIWNQNENKTGSGSANGPHSSASKKQFGPNGVEVLPEEERLHDLDDVFD